MLQKIRLLYPQSDADAFEGTVECDEVYIGGKEKWKHKSMRTPHTHVSRIFFGENKETKKEAELQTWNSAFFVTQKKFTGQQ